MILPSNPGFRYVGRFGNLGTDSVSIGWSNSLIECFFTGTSVGISLDDPGENYFNYVIDSGEPIRKSSKETDIVSGLSSGEHTIQIIKSTESDWDGPVKFKGLDVESIKEKPAEKEIQKAIEHDAFEEAAILRDQLNKIKGNGKINTINRHSNY